MATTGLIGCPDCGAKVSPRAASCPHCGAPAGGVTTTQTTSKKWKFLMAVGAVLIMVGGFPMAVTLAAADGSVSPGFCTPALITGLFLILTARIAAWWHHG